MRRRYLIAYDIADDKRRNEVFTTLMGSGDHVQFSVFLCDLNRRELAEVKGQLTETINHRHDQVIILDAGRVDSELRTVLQCIGKAYQPHARVVVV